MWTDPRFAGLGFEEVVLSLGHSRTRLDGRYAISITRAGRGIVLSSGGQYEAQSGSGYLFCPDQLWAARTISDLWRFETI